MKKKLLFFALFLSLLAMVPTAGAQLGGEELPEGVSHDDVYRVADEMYCDVCAGIPLSTCASVTCQAWRQEIANLLGQGYSDEAIFSYFAERYGDDVTGIPLEENDRGLALGLPLLVAVLLGLLVVWQLWRSRLQNETRAHQAARAAGIDLQYNRPVPNNVDRMGLDEFLRLVEEGDQ